MSCGANRHLQVIYAVRASSLQHYTMTFQYEPVSLAIQLVHHVHKQCRLTGVIIVKLLRSVSLLICANSE